MILALIALLAYIALGFALVVNVHHKLSRRGHPLVIRLVAVLGVGFIAWAIPFGDHYVGKREFLALCATEAGAQIVYKAMDVDGFEAESWLASGDTLKEWGYSFAEVLQPDGLVRRFRVGKDGKTIEELDRSLIAKHRLLRTRARMSPQIIREEFAIVDRVTGQLLARHVSFGHSGGWLYRQLEALHAYREWCPRESFSITTFTKQVLVPKGVAK